MDPKDLAGLTVYSDLLTVLKEKGYSDEEATEIFMKLTAQAEVEVVEELLGKLSEEQLKTLDELPDNTPPEEIADKLGLDGEEVDEIRARKTAEIINDLVPLLDEGDEETEDEAA